VSRPHSVIYAFHLYQRGPGVRPAALSAEYVGVVAPLGEGRLPARFRLLSTCGLLVGGSCSVAHVSFGIEQFALFFGDDGGLQFFGSVVVDPRYGLGGGGACFNFRPIVSF
jgi:hypothetical protein